MEGFLERTSGTSSFQKKLLKIPPFRRNFWKIARRITPGIFSEEISGELPVGTSGEFLEGTPVELLKWIHAGFPRESCWGFPKESSVVFLQETPGRNCLKFLSIYCRVPKLNPCRIPRRKSLKVLRSNFCKIPRKNLVSFQESTSRVFTQGTLGWIME